MQERLLHMKKFFTGHSLVLAAFVALLLLSWGAVGWLSVPKYASPIDEGLMYPSYIQFENHYLGLPELFLIFGKPDDAIGDDVVVPCTPWDAIGPIQALYLIEMDEPPSDEENEEYWEYRLTLFYTSYTGRLDKDASQGGIPPVTIQVYSYGLSIDGVMYTLPEGCAPQGIERMIHSMYLSYYTLAKGNGFVPE